MPSNLDEVKELLQQLQKRISRIENYLELGQPASPKGSEEDKASREVLTGSGSTAQKESLEFRIGEYWLAQVGVIVLMLGLAFLVSYPFSSISPILISLIGYLAVTGIFTLSKFWDKTYQYLAKVLFGGGLILGYYVTLRLHFFNSNPVLSNKSIGIAFTVIAAVLIFHQALRRRSELFSAFSILLCYITALLSDSTPIVFLFIIFTAIASAYILIRFNWPKILWLSTVLAYLSHLIWMVNNPLLGKPIQAVLEHQNNFIYLFVYFTIFSLANLFRKKEIISTTAEFTITFLNSIGFFAISLLSIQIFHKTDLALLSFAIGAFFIIMAALNWLRHKSKYPAAVYSCFGYLVLSIAILTQFNTPDYIIWLSWQSLLVISTALWFHSRIIIVVNFMIFLGILLIYWGISESSNFVNLSYGIVALVSARILNWQKERLELKTEKMRNAYLFSAFVVVLYGLFQAVPGNYVGLSWLGAALFYFAMSQLLHNVKYRWMAILTIFATVLHVFFVDLARVGAAFRIILFLAVGLVLLIVSLRYTKMQKIKE